MKGVERKRSARALCFLSLIILMRLLSCVEAVNYYVSKNGSDRNSGLSWEEALATIQQGLNLAGAGDTVDVNVGIYRENVNFNGFSCTLKSREPNDWDTAAATIIDGGGWYGDVVTLRGDCRLEGLTIRNGGESGVYCASGTSPTIEGCIIEGNGWDGITIYSHQSSRITGNRISGNGEAGIYMLSGEANIRNNWIFNNETGINVVSGSLSVAIVNNTIVGNISEGIYILSGGSPVVSNCILWYNGKNLEGAIAVYSCISEGGGGLGNISGYPYFKDYTNGDFHLTANSPCIDKGDPQDSNEAGFDNDGESRVFNGRIDIGADEFLGDGDNLVSNPGFEDDQDLDGIPDTWTDAWSSLLKTIDKAEKHSGESSWRFDNDGTRYSGAFSDYIAVNPYEYYGLSAWIKSYSANEDVVLGWEEYDQDYNVLYNTNFILNHETVGTKWTRFSGFRQAGSNSTFVRLRFFGPYRSSGSVWWDDFELISSGTEYLRPFGCINDANAKSVNFGTSAGSNENWVKGEITNYMTDPAADESIEYRELLPLKTLEIDWPGFNIDSNGMPLSHMLLEVNFKDTVEIDQTLVRAPSSILVYSRIGYRDPDGNFDSDYLKDPDERWYSLFHLGGWNNNKWRYMQYAFQKSYYQLLRAYDWDNDGQKEFSIKIISPEGMQLPVDYISLRKISDLEYETLVEKQRYLRGFKEVDLPSDGADSSVNYNDPNITVFVRDTMRPVYEHTKPDINEPDFISLSGACGETEAATFSMYSVNGINDLVISITDLVCSQDSNCIIDGNDIEIFKVIYDEVHTSNYPDKNYALVPERLNCFDTVSIDPNTSQRIWLKFHIPIKNEGGISGKYTGNVNISENGSLNKNIPIELTIKDIFLNRTTNLNSVYHDPFTKVYSSNLDVVLDSYAETDIDPFIYDGYTHRIKATKDANGLLVFDTNNFEFALDRIIESNPHIETLHAYIPQSLWREVYSLTMDETYNSSDADLYFKLSDMNFVRGMEALLAGYVSTGNDRNLDFIFHITDEPGTDEYRRIITDRLCTIIKEYDDFGVLLTGATYYTSCDESIYAENYNTPGDMNIPPLTNLIDYKIWAIRYIEEGYKKHLDPNYHGNFGYYTTYHSNLHNPVYNRFLHGLFAFATDAKTVASYAMGDYSGDPYNDFDPSATYIYPFVYPDFILAYPTWSGELLPAIGGLEAIREGIKDAKYIAKLEDCIELYPDSEIAQQGQAYLDGLKERIDPNYYPAYVEKGTELGYYQQIIKTISENDDPNDFEAFTEIRKKVADYIIAIEEENGRKVYNQNKGAWFGGINEAIDAAESGDELIVQPGVYYENVDFDGKSIILRSTDPNDRKIVATTIIDGNSSGRVVTIDDNEGGGTVLAGFTIQNGIAVNYPSFGGGIYCYGSSPLISKCVIKDNYSSSYGGGMFTGYGGNPVVEYCRFVGNSSVYGGAVGVLQWMSPSSHFKFYNCIFEGNVGNYGGGLYKNGLGKVDVFNCTFFGNSVSIDGGGLFLGGLNTEILNCIFYGNTALRNGDQICDYGFSYEPYVYYCCIEDSASGLGWDPYCGVDGGGNIDVDPYFVKFGYTDVNGTPADTRDDFWVEGDYHLKSEQERWDEQTDQWVSDEATSRCIDSGNPGSSPGEEFCIGSKDRINMGAYGGTNEASISCEGWGVLADLNNDGVANFADFSIQWQNLDDGNSFKRGDLNRDGVVNLADFADFCDYWLEKAIWH